MKLDDYLNLINLDGIAGYVHSCQCPGGGFCFYGLDEPNLADTFFAARTLALLSRAPLALDKTLGFVRDFFQSPLGEGSLWGIYYGLGVLRLYQDDVRDRSQLTEILLGFYNRRVSGQRGSKSLSLELLSHVVEAIQMLGCSLEHQQIRSGQHYVLQFQNEDGGFGVQRSNLWETSFAISLLKALSYPVQKLPVQRFLLDLEHEDFGFCTVPGSTPAFLEDIYLGLTAFRALELTSRYETAVLRFMLECQTGSYGFRRSRWLGIPTLEYTYMAVKSLDIIRVMKGEETKEDSTGSASSPRHRMLPVQVTP